MLNKNKAMHKTRLTQTRKQNTQVMHNKKRGGRIETVQVQKEYEDFE